MVNVTQIAQSIWWVLSSINITGMLFQIHRNQSGRSTKGLSFWMLFTYHSASMSLTIYTHFLNLPYALKVMLPFEFTAISCMVLQEVVFAHHALRMRVFRWHGTVLALCALAVFFGQSYPQFIGNLMGWIAVSLLAVYQLPQIYHNWQNKSVKGVSLPFIFCSMTACVVGMWSMYVLSMPIQSWVSSIRALTKRLIILFQFWLYHDKSPRNRPVKKRV